MMRKSIYDQIIGTRLALAREKPRSRRHTELELRLRNLIVKQLRAENRKDRKAS